MCRRFAFHIYNAEHPRMFELVSPGSGARQVLSRHVPIVSAGSSVVMNALFVQMFLGPFGLSR